MTDVHTRGDVIVNKLQIGDITYEYEYNACYVARVLTSPERDENGYWTWTSENIYNGEVINYGVNENYSHYSSKLYTHEAYVGNIRYIGKVDE